MKTPLHFCLALVFATSFSHAGQQTGPGYRISGVVIDALTSAPVPHAELSIDLDGEESTMTSGADGHFLFAGVEPGKYPISAKAPGYVPESYNEHGAFSTAIVVGSGLDSEHLIFRLHREAVVAGKVTDERGEPVRDAQVMLFKSEKANSNHSVSARGQVQTNDIGEFRFAHLSAGKYFLAVDAHPWYAQVAFDYAHAGQNDPEKVATFVPRLPAKADNALDVVYPLTFYPGVTDEHAAAELNLAAGDKEEANIQLQAVPSVHVRLTNLPVHGENGFSIFEREKVFGSTIIPLNAPSGVISPNEYEVAGLPPGQVTLVVSQNGSDATYSRTINANLSEGETLNASERGGMASVSGRVTFPAGAPIPMRATVLLAGDDEQNVSSPLQKDGTFSFAPLPRGTYKVSVDPDINEEYIESISATGAKVSEKEITIEAAGDVQLNINMAQGFGRVTGVANLDGKPAAGLMVLLVPGSGRNLQYNCRIDQSDSDGTFALPAIAPGKYLLVAIEDGWDLDWTNESVLKPYLEKARSLQISANDQLKLLVDAQRKKAAGEAL